jgi:hypothetical protein
MTLPDKDHNPVPWLQKQVSPQDVKIGSSWYFPGRRWKKTVLNFGILAIIFFSEVG